MFEAIRERMKEAGIRLTQADSETLWIEIINLAQKHDYPLANSIIQFAQREHWTVQHTALALAYTHMILANDHRTDLTEIISYQTRPLLIRRHCSGCLCEDKSLEAEDV